MKKFAPNSDAKLLGKDLSVHLDCISRTYQELDTNENVGGGHFFSMRDFFFCVKSFVCSVLNDQQLPGGSTIAIRTFSNQHLISSAIRNFGGHSAARSQVRRLLSQNLNLQKKTIPKFSPLDLIVENISDSSKMHSVHIARHLMILSRSMVALQLVDRHVRQRLPQKLNWQILFGSCFPGDLEILAVTRKLRQVEQAIRNGGVLILCHAEQLFESLYMVLNQQYWAQNDVTMTQIALGPTTRSIALPEGMFRIIALQVIPVENIIEKLTCYPWFLCRILIRLSIERSCHPQFYLDSKNMSCN